MIIRLLFVIFFTWTCAESNAQVSIYAVKKIKTVRNYYVIYVVKDDSTYKVISKKEKSSGGKKIRINESYPFKLSRVNSLAGPEVECFSFDEKTVFCKEPDIELAVASNLKGLCLF